MQVSHHCLETAEKKHPLGPPFYRLGHFTSNLVHPAKAYLDRRTHISWGKTALSRYRALALYELPASGKTEQPGEQLGKKKQRASSHISSPSRFGPHSRHRCRFASPTKPSAENRNSRQKLTLRERYARSG